MAWRNPRFCYLHAARDAGLAAITTVGTESTTSPLENLISERMTVPFAWTDDTTSHSIDIDLGASPPTGFDRLYIPTGHNLNGGKIKVIEDSVDTFDSPATTLYAEASISSTAAVDITLTASSERYLRVSFPTVSGAWSIPELWITETVATTEGPETSWSEGLIDDVERYPDNSTVLNGIDRRRFEMLYRALGTSVAADLTALEAFAAAVSTFRPFIFDPPYDTEATIVCRLDADVESRADTSKSNPAARMPRMEFSITQYLG